MASTAANGASPPPDEDLLMEKPPEHVTIPPKVVRDKVHSTASFVHRQVVQGKETIEEDMMARLSRPDEAGKKAALLSFVRTDDVNHAYYVWYKELLFQGKGPRQGGNRTNISKDKKPKGPPEPPKFRFSARMPNISAQDLEIVKLTAQYTAKAGENWLKELRNRHSGDYQFDFLRANHSFHQYFRALVDQYRILIEEEETIAARLAEVDLTKKNPYHILDRAKQRAEYTKYQSQQKAQEEQKIEDDKKQFLSVDWQDFTVVATVDFDENDEKSDLPPPKSLNDLQSASLEEKAQVSMSMRIEEARPDDETYYNINQQSMSDPPPVHQGMYAPTPPPFHPDYAVPPPVAVGPYAVPAPRTTTPGTGPGGVRIRTDYVPRAKKANVQMVICPNCNSQIAADELDEHIRIELLDPRWKEQKDKATARYAPVNVPTADIAKHLKRFASNREDIFDKQSGQPLEEEEAARRKKAALAYDGQPDPVRDAARMQEMQTMNVQEQIRRINEKHGRK
ncbi:hypothetical protein P154DRAFT_519815 [Amniculicola lignicola CBS 123094]|uniref:SURP motif domain-containing protein n=1 Tax=Amniculicola lignicola CBS 123094 TaxID=1392246 RepID=A0A6A5WXW4_9PLEO|nr:hypothetical protein P154DRAFT_519815 [Amniculicola lignicola CBS 123094]